MSEKVSTYLKCVGGLWRLQLVGFIGTMGSIILFGLGAIGVQERAFTVVLVSEIAIFFYSIIAILYVVVLFTRYVLHDLIIQHYNDVVRICDEHVRNSPNFDAEANELRLSTLFKQYKEPIFAKGKAGLLINLLASFSVFVTFIFYYLFMF